MRLVFFNLESWEKKALQKAFPKDSLTFVSGALDAKNAGKYKDAEAISVFIHSNVDNVVLEKLPKLKLITTRSTGFDHIDVDACKQRKIHVANVPSYGENTVAEHTFTLLLALSRKIVPAVERTRSGSFSVKDLRGFDLAGKTIGVIGTGGIGQHVVRMAYGFEMNILAFDLHKNSKLEKKFGAKYVPLKKLFKEADIVSVHVPYNKHTHHLLDKKAFALCKKGAFIINTSRGPIVDTNALYQALKSKKLGGAALDVMEEECHMGEDLGVLRRKKANDCDIETVVENHKLLKMPNVIVTPHNAFNTHEALQRILDTTIDSIKQFKKGKKINKVS